MDQREILRLYQLYADDVYRLALSYLHNSHDAEDVTQSVFMKLLELKKPLFQGKEKTWLLTCAANACKNQLRSFWRKNVKELDDKLSFESKEDQDLWSIVRMLPPIYRAVIHLYYYEGYSHKEIAEILHISITAVQTRMSRARNQLKEVLIEYDN